MGRKSFISYSFYLCFLFWLLRWLPLCLLWWDCITPLHIPCSLHLRAWIWQVHRFVCISSWRATNALYRGVFVRHNEIYQEKIFLSFIYFIFWLWWVFVAAHRLSLVVVSRGYSSLQCMGFSFSLSHFNVYLFGCVGSSLCRVESSVVVHGFSSCSTQT